jgi:diacylglycerol kinase family enzyme
MIYRRGSRIRIETDPPCQAQADGELIGLTPLDISVEPLSVKILVPAD